MSVCVCVGADGGMIMKEYDLLLAHRYEEAFVATHPYKSCKDSFLVGEETRR